MIRWDWNSKWLKSSFQFDKHLSKPFCYFKALEDIIWFWIFPKFGIYSRTWISWDLNIICTFSITNNILQPFPTQQTALHLAAEHNPAAVPILLEANARVNVVTDSNASPLFYAALYNHREAVIALCAAGADPHLGWSPLTDSLFVSEEMKNLIREQLSL